MPYLQIALLITGLILLATGYFKNHRNLLLAAAISLFFAGSANDLIAGIQDGYTEARLRHS